MRRLGLSYWEMAANAVKILFFSRLWKELGLFHVKHSEHRNTLSVAEDRMVSADIKKDPKMTVWFFFNLCGCFACLCVWVTLACFVSWEKGSRHSGATVTDTCASCQPSSLPAPSILFCCMKGDKGSNGNM